MTYKANQPTTVADRQMALFWTGVLVISLAVFLALVVALGAKGQLLKADQSISNFVQSLRTASGEKLMVAVTMLGDGKVLTPLAVGTIFWLVWRKVWYVAGVVVVAFVFASAFVPYVKNILHRARPLELYTGSEAFSFPSGHAALSASILGIVAILISAHQSPRTRVFVMSVGLTLVVAIAFSRIYLGAHWPSDVVAGVSFGLAMTATVALALTRLAIPRTARPRFAPFAVGLFAISASIHLILDFHGELSKYRAVYVKSASRNCSVSLCVHEPYRAIRKTPILKH